MVQKLCYTVPKRRTDVLYIIGPKYRQPKLVFSAAFRPHESAHVFVIPIKEAKCESFDSVHVTGTENTSLAAKRFGSSVR